MNKIAYNEIYSNDLTKFKYFIQNINNMKSKTIFYVKLVKKV